MNRFTAVIKRLSKGNWGNYLLIAVILALLPLGSKNAFYQAVLIMVFLNAIFASSWNIIAGFAGQFSLGHAAFFGIGAYVSTILYTRYGLSPWAGLCLGALAAAVIGAGIGYPCFRLRGPFFSLATVAFAEIARIVAIQAKGVTQGAVGIAIPFRPALENMIFYHREAYAYLILFVLLVVQLAIITLNRSKLGWQLVAVREDEDAAQAMGVNSTLLKLVAMMLSAGIAGIAGVLYAQYVLYIEPNVILTMDMSLQPALMGIIGGLGTVWGPVVGAVLVTVLGEFLRASLGGSAAGLHLIVYGVLLIVIVIVMPEGLLGTVQKRLKKRLSLT